MLTCCARRIENILWNFPCPNITKKLSVELEKKKKKEMEMKSNMKFSFRFLHFSNYYDYFFINFSTKYYLFSLLILIYFSNLFSAKQKWTKGTYNIEREISFFVREVEWPLKDRDLRIDIKRRRFPTCKGGDSANI